eukprot:TRINITY_DN23847_c0_g1_i2.p1 TRINITY_DN23847_c0_g1~~TRINITY_DN23847_c0_g1_i2.p1  ORF type:complete len:459 (+),score=60.38 TRINITY_DN23847_c0_g1_i2:198-1379(+)
MPAIELCDSSDTEATDSVDEGGEDNTLLLMLESALLSHEPLSICDGSEALPDHDRQPLEGGKCKGNPLPGEAVTARGRSQVRGINSHLISGRLYYRAQIAVGFLQVMCRSSRDLALAVDHLNILASFRQSVLGEASRYRLEDVPALTERFRNSHHQVADDLGADAWADLGMMFSLQLGNRHWMGTRTLATPSTSSIEEIMQSFQRFAEVQQALMPPGATCVPNYLLNHHSPKVLEDNWHAFKEAYLEAVCGHSGQSLEEACGNSVTPSDNDLRAARADVKARLDKIASENAENRERALRRWNYTQMRNEERQQRRWIFRQRGLPEKIDMLARKWQHLRERHARRAQRFAQEEHRKRKAEEQQAARRRKIQRDVRWRWMNRPDLTMADILGNRT